MRLLLDTHVFLWLHTEPERLGEHLGTVEDQRNELLASAVISWEMAIKSGLGRLSLPEPVERYVPARIRDIGAVAVPIEHTHALAVVALPRLHGDPFDRLLVAQAKLLDVTLLTADPAIAEYPVQTMLLS